MDQAMEQTILESEPELAKTALPGTDPWPSGPSDVADVVSFRSA